MPHSEIAIKPKSLRPVPRGEYICRVIATEWVGPGLRVRSVILDDGPWRAREVTDCIIAWSGNWPSRCEARQRLDSLGVPRRATNEGIYSAVDRLPGRVFLVEVRVSQGANIVRAYHEIETDDDEVAQ